MTTYTPILNAEVDAESPVTDLLMTRLRDNPLAIAEGDASVPIALQGMPLLGTLTTTSGTIRTLSSLVLTPYKSIRAVWNGVSHTDVSAQYFSFAGQQVITGVGRTEQIYGIIDIDLLNGIGISSLANLGAVTSAVSTVINIRTSLTNASTSISVSVSAGSFDLGSIKIYGVK